MLRQVQNTAGSCVKYSSNEQYHSRIVRPAIVSYAVAENSTLIKSTKLKTMGKNKSSDHSSLVQFLDYPQAKFVIFFSGQLLRALTLSVIAKFSFWSQCNMSHSRCKNLLELAHILANFTITKRF